MVRYYMMTKRVQYFRGGLKQMTRQGRMPKKFVIEPTTRCNFACQMCVKQAPGCQIPEGDLCDDLFDRCKPFFNHASSIIFTGIGEPLLHPNLDKYIKEASLLTPPNSVIGFQTNGKLLTRHKAVSLLQSGLNKICVSVDTIIPRVFDQVRNGGTLEDVDAALDALLYAKNRMQGVNLSIGIEFVLMKKNLAELPELVLWSGRQGIDFIIVTHMTAYDRHLENEQLFLNNSHDALALFETYRAKAESQDLDIMSYSPKMVKFYNTPKEQQLCDLVAQLKEEALKKDIYLNLFHLLSEPPGEYDRIKSVFEQAGAFADENKITLTLPRIRPQAERYCRFVEESTLFVTWQGQVAPCYFLWHRYNCMRAGYTKHVDPVYFGDVTKDSLENIWNDPEYVSFRQDVVKYEYPNCHTWCEKRCDYVLEAPFFQDCYINSIPCADCQWNLGFLNCLS